MLIELIFAAIFFGWLRGGRLKNLASTNLIGAEWLIAALAAQILVPRLSAFSPETAYFFHVFSYTIMLVVLALNRPGLAELSLLSGVFLNFLVISLNGGMPVDSQAVAAGFTGDIHVRLTEATVLPWLGDIITWPLPAFLGGLVSVGDLFLGAGVFLLVLGGMKYKGQRRLEKRPIPAARLFW